MKHIPIKFALILAAVTLIGSEGVFSDTPKAPLDEKNRSVTPASQDLNDLAFRYMNSLIIRDADYAEANSIDEPRNSFLGITTSPNGFYNLPDLIEHVRPLPRVELVDFELKGYVDGNVAWFAGRGFANLPNGLTIPARYTMVMRYTTDGWKAVQFHLSEPFKRSITEK